jgi:hypothetical protein
MQDSRTQIIIGLFSLIGVLGTALISNWDKLFSVNPPANSISSSSSISPLPVPPIPSASPPPTVQPSPLVKTAESPALVASPAPSFNVIVPTEQLQRNEVPIAPSEPRWKFFGKASTGETIFVETSSISRSGEYVDFSYRIGSERLTANADCEKNQWYVKKYDKWFLPSSQSTQDMLDYVCR